MNTTFFVEVWFSYDRPNYKIGPEWVKNRIEIFEKFTLNSIINQTFQDFRVLLYCGERNREVTSNHPWHERVEICYDLGKKKYGEVNTDYISITRLDSDDMLHKEAMEEIKNNIILSDKRECLLFRWHYQWDILNYCIRRKLQIAGPFFTHIFPKSIYKNWDHFSKEHIVEHPRAGGMLMSTRELGKFMVCIIGHGQNISYLKRGLKYPILNEKEMEKMKNEIGEDLLFDHREICNILKDFSVSEELINKKEK